MRMAFYSLYSGEMENPVQKSPYDGRSNQKRIYLNNPPLESGDVKRSEALF
jgi:hypothetical protein